MRQENYRNKLKINRITTALLGIFFYIILVLVLKTIQNWIPVGSTGIKIFGIIELIAVIAYFVLYTWWNFKSASQETVGTFCKYLLLIMIPFVVMTLLTIIISSIGSNGNFGSNWNAITFFISPTVFCFIPFGIIYQVMSSIPISVFFIICLVMMAAFQFLGFVLGNGSRKYAREREMIRAEQDRKMMQRQDTMARQATEKRQQNTVRRESTARKRAPVDANDPLKDVENTAVVETEAFSRITDEMIREAIRQKKIKTTEQKVAERMTRNASNQKISQKDAHNEIKITELDTQKKIEEYRERKQTNQADQTNKERLQSTQNLQKELALIRERLEKEDKQ